MNSSHQRIYDQRVRASRWALIITSALLLLPKLVAQTTRDFAVVPLSFATESVTSSMVATDLLASSGENPREVRKALAPAANRRDLYLDADFRSSPRDGSREHPFKSVAEAWDPATNGSRLLMAPGAYPIAETLGGKSVILQPLGGTVTLVPGDCPPIQNRAELLTPYPGRDGALLRPNFSWSYLGRARSYEMELWQEGNPGSKQVFPIAIQPGEVVHFTLPSQVPDLTGATTYRWQVRGVDACGRPGLWSESEPGRFTTVQTLPATPDLGRPKHDTSGVRRTPRFEWSPADRATSYLLHIEDAGASAAREMAVTGTSFQLADSEPLGAGTRVKWRVLGVNARGTGSWSEERAFTTLLCEVENKPILQTPREGRSDALLRPNFSWSRLGNAARYELRLSSGGDLQAGTKFIVPAQEGEVVVFHLPAAVPDLEGGTTYSWQVVGVDRFGAEGPGSAKGTFTTRQAEAQCDLAEDLGLELHRPEDGDMLEVGAPVILEVGTISGDGEPVAMNALASLQILAVPASIALPPVTGGEIDEGLDDDPEQPEGGSSLNPEEYCQTLPADARVLLDIQSFNDAAGRNSYQISGTALPSGEYSLFARGWTKDGKFVVSEVVQIAVGESTCQEDPDARLELGLDEGGKEVSAEEEFWIEFAITGTAEDEDASVTSAAKSFQLLAIPRESLLEPLPLLGSAEDTGDYPAGTYLALEEYCGRLPSGARVLAEVPAPFTANENGFVRVLANALPEGEHLLLARAIFEEGKRVAYSSLLRVVASTHVEPPTDELRIEPLRFAEDGSVEVSISGGSPGATLILQRSSDFLLWEDVDSSTVMESEGTILTDLEPPETSAVYRVKVEAGGSPPLPPVDEPETQD